MTLYPASDFIKFRRARAKMPLSGLPYVCCQRGSWGAYINEMVHQRDVPDRDA